MTVKKLYTAGRVLTAGEADFRDPVQEPLLRTALLCSDATVSEDGEVGDPTETALVRLGEDHGFDEGNTRSRWPRITEIPFDSDRKLMSTVHVVWNGEYVREDFTLRVDDEAVVLVLGNVNPNRNHSNSSCSEMLMLHPQGTLLL